MGIYPIFIHFYCAYCTINTFLTLFHTLYFTFLLYILFSIPLMFLSLIYQLLCIKNDSGTKAGVIFSLLLFYFLIFSCQFIIPLCQLIGPFSVVVLGNFRRFLLVIFLFLFLHLDFSFIYSKFSMPFWGFFY